MNIIELECTKEKYILDYIAKQSSGAVFYQHGGTVMIASVAVDNDPVEGDFLPLTVQYIEKSYAVGKFPGGFIKREGKPGEFETLTSRIIDRTLRPIFPKGYAYPTQITILVLSYDRKSDLQVCALNAAANALYVSPLPFSKPIAGVRIGKIDGKLVLNPEPKDLQNSQIDLYVSGSNEELLMIEMRSIKNDNNPNIIPEAELLEILEFAKEKINKISTEYTTAFQDYKKTHIEIPITLIETNSQIYQYIQDNYDTKLTEIITEMSKSERNDGLKKLVDEIHQNFNHLDKKEVEKTLEFYKKQKVRQLIINEGIRADGRKTKEIRPISIQTNILPFAHGSVLFTRGQTQALVVSTIGTENDAQTQELLQDKNPVKEKFMFHYNFPGFSVGEATYLGSVGRRELGHGNLAKRALESSILDNDKTIRLVSEILESNGSSSMASVCGGSLALCASGIEISSLISGVAMGLVMEGDKYAILSDINGLEDHDGDMDFKVAGSENGITAMQMDIKLGGISFKLLKEALYQAKEARIHILKIMQEAKDNIIINTNILPSSETFCIQTNKIVEIIGQGGKVIRDIIDRFGVNIDLNRENGEVKISSAKNEDIQEAKEFILKLIASQKADLEKYEIGETFEGEVKKILDFGAFVSLPRGGDGLVHISKITQNKEEDIKIYFQEGSKINCQISGYNKGKIELNWLKD